MCCSHNISEEGAADFASSLEIPLVDELES